MNPSNRIPICLSSLRPVFSGPFFALLVFALVWIAAAPPASSAQEQRPITPEDVWNVQRVSLGDLSPDGNTMVYTVTRYDIEENNASQQLYVQALDGSAARPLTAQRSDRQPAWSPDGKRIAFVSGRDSGPAQLYVIPVDGGEAGKITDLPVGVSSPKWFPDGRHIAFVASVIPGYGGDFEKLGRMIDEERSSKVTAKVTENRIYRHWDRWLTDGRYPRIFKLDVETGDITDLMPGSKRYFAMMGGAEFDISPDGKELAVSANSNPPPYEYLNYDIFLFPTDGSGTYTNITSHNPANDLNPVYSPNGRTLLYSKRVIKDFYADRVRLVFYDRENADRTVIDEVSLEGTDLSPSRTIWSSNNREVFFTAQHHAMTSIFAYDIRRNSTREVHRGGTNSGILLTGNRLVFNHNSFMQPPEIYSVNTNGRQFRPLTDFNTLLMSEIDLGRVEYITYEGANGADVQMYVAYPPGFDEEKTWPLLVQIHGGPHGIFGDEFHFRWNAPVFAAPGYVVALPNFHGSTSFGQEFTKSIHGAHSELPYRDIMKATELMASRPYIDEERMAAAGGSYGGYMVSWIAGHTDRFKALINHAGVYNIMGQFASDVTHHRQAAYDGAPWDGLENLQRWNPAMYAENFVTPMLILHGELDYRVPVTQGLEIYGVYKGKGLDARLVYYPDENHWILNPQNSIHWFGEFNGWLLRYIGAGPQE